jgi:hypothetical protein
VRSHCHASESFYTNFHNRHKPKKVLLDTGEKSNQHTHTETPGKKGLTIDQTFCLNSSFLTCSLREKNAGNAFYG